MTIPSSPSTEPILSVESPMMTSQLPVDDYFTYTKTLLSKIFRGPFGVLPVLLSESWASPSQNMVTNGTRLSDREHSGVEHAGEPS